MRYGYYNRGCHWFRVTCNAAGQITHILHLIDDLPTPHVDVQETTSRAWHGAEEVTAEQFREVQAGIVKWLKLEDQL